MEKKLEPNLNVSSRLNKPRLPVLQQFRSWKEEHGDNDSLQSFAECCIEFFIEMDITKIEYSYKLGSK